MVSRIEDGLDIEPSLRCRGCGAGIRMANLVWGDCINPYCMEGDPIGRE